MRKLSRSLELGTVSYFIEGRNSVGGAKRSNNENKIWIPKNARAKKVKVWKWD